MSEQEWTPAFPGQRPPFQPGHDLSTRHGAYSPRRVDPLATELVALVDADPAVAWLTAADRPALWAWARAEAQVQLLTEYLERAGEAAADGVGDLDNDAVKSAYLLLHRAEARALSGRARLGLDPLSRARLGRDVAATQVDMARLLSDARDVQDAAGRGGEPS
ncbi:P27 family phage terminase small subunit [Blastococcus colisei]|uniref:P27 family phage terminase small subunit n=1 Tax=Blastococcus colisei TaxID=1564162 RepID=UPI00115089AE|nr:P27 family phage terminase small subunit [Blastococcus colisei]